MNQLRLEADEASGKVEELQGKVRTLEQENLSKEQEITSLQHKNGLLEGEVEKLETAIKDFKKAAEDGQQHGTQNETLQRRLQLLEEEAEGADKTLRETNEKYALPNPYHPLASSSTPIIVATTLYADFFIFNIGSVKPMSRPVTSNAKSRPSSRSATSGSRSTRRWPRSTPPCRRSWRTCSRRLVPSKAFLDHAKILTVGT